MWKHRLFHVSPLSNIVVGTRLGEMFIVPGARAVLDWR